MTPFVLIPLLLRYLCLLAYLAVPLGHAITLTMQQTTMPPIPAVNTIEIKQGAELMIKASIIPLNLSY